MLINGPLQLPKLKANPEGLNYMWVEAMRLSFLIYFLFFGHMS